MKKTTYLPILFLLLMACNLFTPQPDPTATLAPVTSTSTPTLSPVATLTATPEPSATAAPILPPLPVWTTEGYSRIETAELVIRIWELQSKPILDPLRFTTLDGTVHARDEMGYGERFRHQFVEGSSINMLAMLGEKKLVTTENYSPDGSQGWAIVSQDDQELYRIAVGWRNPAPAVRMFWTLNEHWFLETNFYTQTAPYHGQLSEDGILLNEKYGYDEIFNSQNLGGKPFFLFQRNGQIDAWYDGQELPLGFDLVHHYTCCSHAQLNPMRWIGMQAFFATRGDTWYFAQIGTPDNFK